MMAMDLQHKYDVMLAAFVGLIMVTTGCTQEQAVRRVAILCATAEAVVFGSAGEAEERKGEVRG